MAREPDFCVRLATNYDSKVIDLGRPFVEDFLNPAAVNGYGHPLMFENFDVATIILSTMTLPLKDQEQFISLWEAFYKENAHPDVHEEIIKCVEKAEAATTREEKEHARSEAASKGKQVDPYVFEGHTLKDMVEGGLWEGVPVISLIQNACPLETFLIAFSEALFLFPEDQRLERTTGFLAQYPRITQPLDLINYVMEEGEIDRELHRLVTFLMTYGNSEFELEGALPSIVWWFAGVSPVITIKDMQDVEVKVREILESNENVITFREFHALLSVPYLRWEEDRKKTS